MNDIWKVVKIISDYRIVINGGTNYFLKKGDRLEIFKEGEEIIDPLTGDFLGTLDLIKAYITIVDVFEKMSVCKNTEDNITSTLNPLLLEVKKPSRLRVDPSEISGPTDEYDKTIRIGDLVRKTK